MNKRNVEQAFARLVQLYGVPGTGSVALEAADPAYAPPDDILGNPVSAAPTSVPTKSLLQ